MLYVLLALSVIISLFGMVNTLVLSVFERTRELGMLRAVGMTRRQVRRMIRHESVITALIGAALGLPLGIFLACSSRARCRSTTCSSPFRRGRSIAFVIVAIIAGLLAAILPARRAARLRRARSAPVRVALRLQELDAGELRPAASRSVASACSLNFRLEDEVVTEPGTGAPA